MAAMRALSVALLLVHSAVATKPAKPHIFLVLAYAHHPPPLLAAALLITVRADAIGAPTH
eukprot:COSAG06_NODE_7326_length_2545_cov_9.379349_4_plen_60_part_00